MSQPEIKLEFVHTEAEYVSANRLLLLSSPAILARLAIFFGLLLAGALVLGLLTELFPLWSVLLLTATVDSFLLYNILVRAPVHYFRGDAKFRDKYHVTFSDEGIAVKTDQIDSKLAWSLYTKVVEGANQYLLVYGKELRTITIVPKRAFTSQAQEEAFRNLVKRHIRDYTRVGRIEPRQIDEPEYKPTTFNPPDWR